MPHRGRYFNFALIKRVDLLLAHERIRRLRTRRAEGKVSRQLFGLARIEFPVNVLFDEAQAFFTSHRAPPYTGEAGGASLRARGADPS